MSDGERNPGGSAKDRRKYKRAQERQENLFGFSDEIEQIPDRQDRSQRSSTSEQEKDDEITMANKGFGAWFRDIFSKERAAAWTAIATIVICIFNGLLWEVTNNANNMTAATQRASISASSPYIVKKIDNGKLVALAFGIGLINSGNTATRSGWYESNATLLAKEPDATIDFNTLPQAERNRFVLGAHIGMQGRPDPVSLADLDEVSSGKKHLIIWGWATYRDGLTTIPRLEEWCFENVNPRWSKSDHTDMSVDATFEAPSCPTHNCYDEDCDDYKLRTQ
jgi:hypothetical protein